MFFICRFNRYSALFLRYFNDSAEAISSIMTEVEMAKNILLLMRKLFDNFQFECGKFNQN